MKLYVKISRTIDRQFKVNAIGGNGERLFSTESLHNRNAGAVNNILAVMRVFNSQHVLVFDESKCEWYNLFPDGSKGIVTHQYMKLTKTRTKKNKIIG